MSDDERLKEEIPDWLARCVYKRWIACENRCEPCQYEIMSIITILFAVVLSALLLQAPVAAIERPESLFRSLGCEILAVTQIAQNVSGSCFDTYTYSYSPSETTAVFISGEERLERQPPQPCTSPTPPVNTSLPSFSIGPATCFRLKDEQSKFQLRVFDCPLKDEGNSKVADGPCYKLFVRANAEEAWVQIGILAGVGGAIAVFGLVSLITVMYYQPTLCVKRIPVQALAESSVAEKL